MRNITRFGLFEGLLFFARACAVRGGLVPTALVQLLDELASKGVKGVKLVHKPEVVLRLISQAVMRGICQTQEGHTPNTLKLEWNVSTTTVIYHSTSEFEDNVVITFYMSNKAPRHRLPVEVEISGDNRNVIAKRYVAGMTGRTYADPELQNLLSAKATDVLEALSSFHAM